MACEEITIMSDIVTYLPTVIAVASAASAVLPAPRPGSVGSLLLGIVNVLALNMGHAANATPAKLKTEHNNTSNQE